VRRSPWHDSAPQGIEGGTPAGGLLHLVWLALIGVALICCALIGWMLTADLLCSGPLLCCCRMV